MNFFLARIGGSRQCCVLSELSLNSLGLPAGHHNHVASPTWQRLILQAVNFYAMATESWQMVIRRSNRQFHLECVGLQYASDRWRCDSCRLSRIQRDGYCSYSTWQWWCRSASRHPPQLGRCDVMWLRVLM